MKGNHLAIAFDRVFIILTCVLPTVFGAGTASTPSVTSPLGPVVDLGYAAYAGNSTSPAGMLNGSVVFFGGIPYAQPPLGDLRFRAPQTLDETVDRNMNVTVVDARNFAPPCVQQPAEVGVGSEDCLHLNIWKPANATAQSKLPVIVYIHGGGFDVRGPEGYPLYDWVAQHPNIVGVGIAYRLNVLGFLAGSAVAADGDLNTGLLDQRAALEWVQRHINQFGGDPERVTIMGESAGGASVVMQTVAYGGTKPVPFKQAIPHSIGYGSMLDPLSPLAEELYENFTFAVGCSNATADTLGCLRTASLESIVTGINAIGVGRIGPTVDGTFIPDLPSRLLRDGRFNTVDLLAGHCTNDGRTFAGGQPSQFVTDADITALTLSTYPFLTNRTLDAVFDFYPKVNASGSPFSTEYDLAGTIAGDVVFTCMDQYMADRMLAKGANNVYTFRWNVPDPVLLAASPYLGVMHTSDLYFLFDGVNSGPNAGFTFTPFNQSEAVLNREAIAYWVSFVSTGNPSSHKLSGSPFWGSFTGSGEVSRSRMALMLGNNDSTQSALERISQFEVDICAFWMQADVTAQTRL